MPILYQETDGYTPNHEIFSEAAGANVIYLAIGPAYSAQQQYPPFMKDLGGKQLCILFDPRLETPLTAEVKGDTERENVTFIPMKTNFYWDDDDVSSKTLVTVLCQMALSSTTCRLIVQDYTGHEIRSKYPLSFFGPALMDRVLFDVTYGESGCFVNLDAVHLLIRNDGSFIQPEHDRITNLKPWIPKGLLCRMFQERNNTITTYALRAYRILCGEEAPEWFSMEEVADRLKRYWPMYGLLTPGPAPTCITKAALVALLSAYWMDVSPTNAALPPPLLDRGYETEVRAFKRAFEEPIERPI
jgi:hypothetical protein